MRRPKHRRELHIETRGRLVLLLAIPIVACAVMLLIAFQARRQAEWVRHTLIVEISVSQLTSHLVEAESAERGFLLTGEEQFLAPYYTAVGLARHDLDTLKELIRDNPTQLRTIGQIRPLVDQRLLHLAQVIQLSRSGLFAVDTAKAEISQGKIIMDQLIGLTQGMFQEEERLLQIREHQLQLSNRSFNLALLLCYGFMVFAVTTLYLDVKRYVHKTIDAESNLSTLNAELDHRVQERTALLQAREELLQTFIEHVPACVAMFDRDMRYLQVSQRWCAEYSVTRSQLLGQWHYERVPGLPERWKAIHRRALDGETIRAEEDRWDLPNGETFWLHWEICPWGNKDGKPEGVVLFTEDITARKHMDQVLRENEATIRALLETAAQAVLAIDTNGKIVIANRMVGEMFSYPPTELIGQQLEILMPERLRRIHLQHRAGFLSDPQPRTMGQGLDLLGRRKDGSEFPIEVSISSFQTARGLISVSFISDITRRKRAEEALRKSEEQLRALAGSLLTAQEDERRRVARELHDGITQQLAFFSMEMGKLASEMGCEMQEPCRKLRALQSQIMYSSNEVRRLSHGLHPSVITDFGLSVALEEYCEEFEKTHTVHIDFTGLLEDSCLDHESATCLYRIAQEGLRNAVLHGGASEIWVALCLDDHTMHLRVRDNGSGFDIDAPRSKIGLGLISMRERIRLVNGNLTLWSKPGQGTEILASVPVARS